jgi:hypothetical protein
MDIEIVRDFPLKIVIFHSFLYVYQRVTISNGVKPFSISYITMFHGDDLCGTYSTKKKNIHIPHYIPTMQFLVS